MSYILEALKKAEAERKLGGVPNLHVQPVPAAIFEDRVPLLRRRLTWWISGLFLMLVILLAWYRPWQEKAAPFTQAAASIEQSAPQKMAAADPASAAAPAPSNEFKENSTAANSPTGKPAYHPQAMPANESVIPEKEMKPQEQPRKSPATPNEKSNEKPGAKAAQTSPVKQQPVEKKADSDAAKSGSGQHKSEPPSAEPPVPALRDLPEHIQRTLPAVTVEGYIYSPKASERSMLINNRLVREGEPISSGLILEKMLPGKEMILNFQGQRYRLPY